MCLDKIKVFLSPSQRRETHSDHYETTVSNGSAVTLKPTPKWGSNVSWLACAPQPRESGEVHSRAS